ncbi:MAG: 50S ribosomal protein L21 [Candidatus Yanofskybacteria bacterium RIFOXYD1_FULL_44_17]|uniref:Large ribosomal subunit protein bL21 n=1 Tax=Candidatus Yanofskybacteria bacterium GW2011_GWE2_40_11 TaxID=1619033 RepID=A0A0G0QIQ7_9BACT|nr:MAG: 50S ribosomal protein L21 [Candidatus Yanofskybacteria bacterium GW2011_GWE1_40_10]KKR40234.1 MAG: 50S ribosomal protein L21 [Candidatus Yanofskybacteria bacterium GW2011_GWE2_40_11]KKT14497.1 MAG: 50S ribosomal protein L21 [Candidatus Yanofskybacteria bacterium GW2011_GWF2_43_596]OGN36142.1 MAG: 50S ribosomal protein L21 [Candidatus Yanofskybacteria bacterium RIFOXYA2_FULL_45_28]OGN36859.1 MAG: 50S ribosomal protein L21 [Candidatus Yanofskybacteria bacterium RIFOXYA1_FULL_44_17]OGN383
MTNKFAIIKTGGKQYKVSEGDTLDIEKVITTDGILNIEEVLLTNDGEVVKVGKPTVKGAKVEAKVLADFKDKKKMVFKFKNKTRQTKKKGHRQPLTKIQITKITA